jgi:hypothetical protein
MKDGGRVAPQVLAAHSAELLVVAGRERTVLVSGFLAGLCVFFVPLAVLAVGLLASYVAAVVVDAGNVPFGPGRALERRDFQAVFAPAVNEAPLLVSCGLAGLLLAQVRRWLVLREDPVNLVHGRRPFFRELASVYLLLIGLILGVAATRAGWAQVDRMLHAAPAFVVLTLCATWLIHAVWSYCFRNIIELLASDPERDAAAALGARRRRLRHGGSHA